MRRLAARTISRTSTPSLDRARSTVPGCTCLARWSPPATRCPIHPHGLVSCLYRLDTRTPVDFSLSAHIDERAAARAHLEALEPGDIVVFDRGYFSFVLLYALVWRGVHPVFRIARNTAFEHFIDGDRDDAGRPPC